MGHKEDRGQLLGTGHHRDGEREYRGAHGGTLIDRLGGAGSGAATFCCSSAVRARARSAEILVIAAVIGAARISPAVPKRAPPAIVTISTASGWMPSAAPIASGWTSCWSTLFASSWTTIIPAAASVPAPPRAIRTENAPAVQ